jgi:hypothetical protein
MDDTAIAESQQGERPRIAEAMLVRRRSSNPLAIGDARATAPPRIQRTFQVVFALLTLEFASLGITYLADPAGAVRGFSRGNQFLWRGPPGRT